MSLANTTITQAFINETSDIVEGMTPFVVRAQALINKATAFSLQAKLEKSRINTQQLVAAKALMQAIVDLKSSHAIAAVLKGKRMNSQENTPFTDLPEE